MNPWLVGGGTLAAFLLLTKKAEAAVITSGYTSGPSGRDLDALADMLITETGFKKGRTEMAQIVWVAVNRARRQDKPIWFVVQPGGAPRPVWNTGPLYRQRFERARTFANWSAARDFAKSVVAGAYPNLKKGSFVHPYPMPTPPCASNRVATSTSYGTRCLPPWIVKGQQIGTAWFA